MSRVLRDHVRAFGFSHSEIARRSARLNQATAYRVVEGETTNPSLKSITGIVEATTLTDADAGVLYRRLAGGEAQPQRCEPPQGVSDHATAADYTKDALDRGRLREAAYGVMAMFDMAADEGQRADAYEQAGIVYLGLGRWEEAQANFEAADALLPGDVNDPALPAERLRRKLTLMTNIGSLMVRRGNCSWALLFGRTVSEHPRANNNDRGWGHLVQGEAALALGSPASAHFDAAHACFERCLKEASSPRQENAALGNLRWAQVHRLHATAQGEALAEAEADWWELDPEAAAMAGFFHAIGLEEKRQRLKLRDVQSRARRHGLGEIAARAARVLSTLALLFIVGIGALQTADSPVEAERSADRGNTGGGK